MKRSLVLGTVLALSLAFIIAVIVIAPTLARPSPYGSIVSHGYSGVVALQLPPGVPSHPTTLFITVSKLKERPDVDLMIVMIWVPEINRFVAVADITDNPDPDAIAWVKELWLGTPIWNPPVAQNVFQVADKELEVRMCGNVLTANLTVPVSITLPPLLGGPFTLPPIALEFRGIDSVYREEITIGPLPSGWTMTVKNTNKPAWVRTWIPQWTGGDDAFKFAGTLTLHTIQTYTPPPP